MSKLPEVSDTEMIFLVLLVIYCWECLCWLRGEAVCFSRASGATYRPLRSLLPVKTHEGRLVFTNLLPLASSLVCEPWPVVLDGEGVLVPASLSETSASTSDHPWVELPYDSIRSIARRDRKVEMNGFVIASLTSDAHADFVVAKLRSLIDAGESRQTAIERLLDESTDVGAISARLSNFRRKVRGLKVCCTAFAGYTFVAGPICYYVPIFAWWSNWWMFTLGFVVLWLVVVDQFHRFRQIEMGDSDAAPWQGVMLLLSPASAMRSAESLSRNAVVGADPLAVAAVVCGKKTFLELAETRLRSVRYPVSTSASPGTTDRQHWFRQRPLTRLDRVILVTGSDPDEIYQAPDPSGDAASYCPRCLKQYVLAEGSCSDCFGVVLKPFPECSSIVTSEPIDGPS